MKKCEYVIQEVNQPSGKALRQFHEHVAEILSLTIQAKAEIDIPLPKVLYSTQDKQKTNKIKTSRSA
ncbi:hypothetical protein SAMN05661091_3436 [Paenibacillus uliginis N3/975]|uniref:Uncharacterized protein n=1 Tax=Paenibacillus uliginis N3/975 TaxID=1313296 RepID=A0A1X7HH97_9BACL|nr:hypothetical protein [Paenibacillus uliginis]SMF86584.1 hypothetical protein SAMN05661091_3436 [Paenibacillus uliginis N3/975]